MCFLHRSGDGDTSPAVVAGRLHRSHVNDWSLSGGTARRRGGANAVWRVYSSYSAAGGAVARYVKALASRHVSFRTKTHIEVTSE